MPESWGSCWFPSPGLAFGTLPRGRAPAFVKRFAGKAKKSSGLEKRERGQKPNLFFPLL